MGACLGMAGATGEYWAKAWDEWALALERRLRLRGIYDMKACIHPVVAKVYMGSRIVKEM